MRMLRVFLTGLSVLLLSGGSFADEVAPVPANPAPGTATTTPDANAPSTAPSNGDKILLRLHLQAGQSYVMHINMEQKMTEIMPKMESSPTMRVDTTTSSRMAIAYDVDQVDANGVATIKLTYRAIQFKSSGTEGGKPLPSNTYDSAADAKAAKAARSPFAATFRALIGSVITVKVTPDGHVSYVQGIESLLKRMLASTSSLKLPPAARAQMTKDLQSMFNQRFFKETFEKSTGGLPEKEVGVGDSWTYHFAMSGNLPIIVNGTRTVLERKDGIIHLAEQGTVNLDTSHVPPTASSSKMTMNLAGTQTGTSTIDEATGFTVGSHLTQRFDGHAKINLPRGAKSRATKPVTMSVPIYGKSTIEVAVDTVHK